MEKTTSTEVACLGILVADTVGLPIDTFPARGTLDLVERIELHCGGNGANTATTLAKLGVKTVLLGKVGADSFGDFLIQSLERTGVDIGGIVRDSETPTAATIVLVHSDAERSFLHVSGANATMSAHDVLWDAVGNSRILHIGGLQLMNALEGSGLTQVLATAKRRGMLTTLDTVMNPRSQGWAGISTSLPDLDWALPSIEEARALTGESKALRQARVFQAAGAKNVAIKMGADGCLVVPVDAEPFHVAAFSVKAVDALGAGDAWAGGFVAGISKGWPLRKTARFANAVGACAVQAVGATTGIRPMDETLAFFGE